MGYKDYMEVMPEEVVSKLNTGYGTRKVDNLSVEDKEDRKVKDITSRVYMLLSKSSAYFKSHSGDKVTVSKCEDINSNHKELIKSMGCCGDYGVYDGYLVPRYLNMDRCYTDHYNCEMDILRLLLLLLSLKCVSSNEKIYEICMDRIEIINTLVLESK